ncbi:GDP-mannose 3,5-epimerase 1 [Candidatus Omnitrophus magneticus]|uniref:GDP-mannose 3,5-epimerase 1 n=1 Tax=Candidatus Omnitrophus magneticus TaxID=1609969 RepID=A0A0F0CNV2_9BACT|nr:GDP-mannose 3,5-epimerase 1 [Candidatus Omnitrophus magneticus]
MGRIYYLYFERGIEMNSKIKVLVTGAGGFIGHHLVKYLKNKGYWVRGVDIKEPQYEKTSADEFVLLDLREFDNCIKACRGVQEVYQLAADMGGIGYISSSHALVLRNNALINLHMLEAARVNNIQNYLYTSSACVYPQYLQQDAKVKMLKEEDAYPADSEPGYGWEKLFSELASQYYNEDYRLKTHIVRFHNIFGPLGAYEGGREKSPAAICRKVALAKDGEKIEVWGDGKQTRSYCYIDDCVEGIYSLMRSDYFKPLNLGQDRLISVDELVDIACKSAGKKIVKEYDLSKPQGVRGRNSDNTRLREVLKWEPVVSLEEGIKRTYKWIESELRAKGRI